MLPSSSALSGRDREGLGGNGTAGLSYPHNPIAIERIVRKMRGGGQAHLVQATDGKYYVAKFSGGPQGDRTLLNELIAFEVIRQLNLSIPNLRLLELQEKVENIDELYFSIGRRKQFPTGMIHLGSECPVNPETKPIFDFLPGRFHSQIENLSEFATMFVIDLWLHQTDSRQAIFIPQYRKQQLHFRAYFIDNGYCFNGCKWELRDVPRPGLAFARLSYSPLEVRPIVEPTCVRLGDVCRNVFPSIFERLPLAWFSEGDQDKLATLFVLLERRLLVLGAMVYRHLDLLGH